LLSNANSNFQVDNTGMVNCLDVKYNGGTSLTTTVSTLNNTISNLATNSYVNSSLENYQPLDTTDTLSTLPINIQSSNPYFEGFPLDQPNWTIMNSATFTNMIGDTLFQTLTFPSTSASLSYSVFPNTYPGQACSLQFSMRGGTTTTITVSFRLIGSNAIFATTTLNNISTTSYTNFNIPFTSPFDEFYFLLDGAVGNLSARNWTVIVGTSVNTRLLGNLNVPYGNITTSDVLYGATASSLTTALSKLSNVANTAPSDLPVSTATQNALDIQNSNFNYVVGQRMSNTNPAFIGNLSGNNGFQVDSSNNIRASGWVSCQSLFSAGDLTFNASTSLANSLNTVNNSINTLNNLRTSGTLASTTTFQTIFSPVNQRGFIYVAAGAPCYSTACAFFEALTNFSFSSLTLISQSGNAAQASINTSSASTGGTVNITLQMTSAVIQVKTSTSCTVRWFVMLF
jgi:hypothetical protein